MKTKLTIILSLISVLGMAQGSVEGNWVLDIDRTIERMDSKQFVKFDTLPAPIKTRAKNSMQGREFRFAPDGSLVVNWKAGTQSVRSTGTWKIDDPSGKLSLTVENENYEYWFEKPTDSVLVLKSAESGGYFNTLYFNKLAN